MEYKDVEKNDKVLRNVVWVIGFIIIGIYVYDQVKEFSNDMVLLDAKMESYTDQLVEQTSVEDEIEIVYGEASHYDYMIGDWSSENYYVCAVRHLNDVGAYSDFAVNRFDCVRVTNLDNGDQVDCKITDFGPSFEEFPERVIDLSAKTFLKLAPLSHGLIKNVSVEQIDCDDMIMY